MTITFTREFGALMMPSSALVAWFFSASRFRAVFADARREDQCIGAVQLGEIGANPVPGLMHKNIQGQLRLLIALGRGRLDVAHVIRDARESFQSGLLAKLPLDIIKAELQRAHDERHGEGTQAV